MKAYVRPNAHHLIDTIEDATGLTTICNETLEQVRQRYPDAIVVDVDEWCAEKQRQQLAPIEWQETDEETYMEMLEVLPPERWEGGAFLVGEAMDHLASTGEVRYEMHRRTGGKYLVSSRPVTVAEFESIVSNKPSSETTKFFDDRHDARVAAGNRPLGE